MSYKGKVLIGDLVVMNELPNAITFEVVDAKMHEGVPHVKLRMYQTDYAAKWHDQSIIHAVVRPTVGTKHLIDLIKKEVNYAGVGDLMEICEMFGHRFKMLRPNEFERVAGE
tara:strand:+ start:909 stop:1244 length:336 start_codon:yes stop_codon:yes gene_type:complete